jgi:hypothetical protein
MKIWPINFSGIQYGYKVGFSGCPVLLFEPFKISRLHLKSPDNKELILYLKLWLTGGEYILFVVRQKLLTEMG